MAETLLSFGVERLWDLLVRESDRLKGVDEQLTVLKSDLELLRPFLKDADAKKHANASVRNCVEEIKEIVFDTEDIIETFLLKEELSKTSGIKKRMRRLSFIIVYQRDLASDMESISKRISKVIEDMKTFGVQQMIVDGSEYSHLLQERQGEMQKMFRTNSENFLVGLEENVKNLVGVLVEEDSTQVVSITGMGGIGKTTLAQQVFNHEMVKNHFDGVAWVCISQQFTRKHVWQTILQELSSNYDEYLVSNMLEDELHDKLFRQLETSKSLIVLDDMWKEEDWDIIKPVFPSKNGYWKVLLTSRIERVGLHVDPKCYIFKLPCLTSEESWTLFQRIAFHTKDTTEFVDVEIEDMGRQMIKHCGGLPLAIKVLGGMLAGKHTLSQWKRVYENFESHINSFNEGISWMYDELYLSFEEIPVYLKHCFLYLAHLPENFAIDVEDLSYYWAAEDILRPRYYDGVSYRKVADGDIEELVKRNLVIFEQDDKISGFRRCRLQNTLRQVCLREAEEENFLQIVDASTVASTENRQSQCKSRRLVIHSSNYKFDVEKYTQNPSLRSLLFIKHYWGAHWKVSNLFFKRLQLMRVLDLSQAQFEGEKLPSNIGELIHLRFLSLYMAKVSHLPSSMRNLRQLLYLNLCVGARSPIYMHNIFKEMRELVYLFLPDDMQDKIKLELGNLINLQTLENFSTKHSSVRDLLRMRRLTTLSIIFNGEGCTLETLFSTVGKLEYLEKLTIGNMRVVGVRVEGKVHPVNKVGLAEKALCGSSGFPQLKKLYLNGLAKWEEWIVEEGSMPLLQTLSIRACLQLKKLPDGLGFTSLQELTIIKLGSELKKTLSRGVDYEKVRNILHLTISEFDNDVDDRDFRVIQV